MIVCPRCGHENPDGSKFCSNCGNSLSGIAGAGPVGDSFATGSSATGSEAPTTGSPTIAGLPTPEHPPVAEAPTMEPPAPAAPPVEPPARTPPPMPEPRAWSARPATGPNDPSSLPASAPEWRMSDAGPLPAPRRRRRWIWIVVGILGACLLLCVGLAIWGNTESGTRVLNDLATSVAEAGTPPAGATETSVPGE